MKTDEEVLFVYSDMQVAHDKEIEKKIGKIFECGTVGVESEKYLFSKIIRESDLSQMEALFPDVKIVYKGKKSSTLYSDITHKSVSEEGNV